MGMRRRWKLFWNLLAFFTVATVVRQWDPKVDDSDLAITAEADPSEKAVWDAYVAVANGLSATVRGKWFEPDKTAIITNPNLGWAYAEEVIDDNRNAFEKLNDLGANQRRNQALPAEGNSIASVEPAHLAIEQLSELLELATIVHLRRNEPEKAIQSTLSGFCMAGQLASSADNLMDYTSVVLGAFSTLRAARSVAADPSTRKENLRLLAESIERLRQHSSSFHDCLRKEYHYQCREVSMFEEKFGLSNSRAPKIDRWELAQNRLRFWASYKPNDTRAMIAARVRAALAATRPENLLQPLTNSVWHQSVATWAESPKSGLTKLSKLRPNFIGERNLMMQEMTCEYEKVFWAHCEYLAALDLTALYIAMHQHRRDHGEFPDSLEVLAGANLAYVPLDRFDGLPLRYDPERRMIYSHWPVDSERGSPCPPWKAYHQEPNICPLRDNGCTVLNLIPRAPDDVAKPNKRSP